MSLQRTLDDLVRGLGDWLTHPPLGWLRNPAERAIIEAFREAGAVSPRRAQRFHPHSALEEAAFQRLLLDGTIRRASAAHYYLHLARSSRSRSEGGGDAGARG